MAEKSFFFQRMEKLSNAFPSPLDRIRTGKLERAAQFGINPNICENSFDANQSFPKSTLTKHKDDVPSPPVSKIESLSGMNYTHFPTCSALQNTVFLHYIGKVHIRNCKVNALYTITVLYIYYILYIYI